jgi:hypothetical protein
MEIALLLHRLITRHYLKEIQQLLEPPHAVIPLQDGLLVGLGQQPFSRTQEIVQGSLI